MKDVMMSIRPQWCEKIFAGKKTIEVRKTRPHLTLPFKVYVYCTGGAALWQYDYDTVRIGECKDWLFSTPTMLNGKVIGEFVCDAIVVDKTFGHDPMLYTAACMTPADISSYCVNSEMYGWHISAPKIYDEPLKITQFIKPCPYDEVCEYCDMYFELEDSCKNAALQLRRPPQSWCYVEPR